MEYVNSVKFDKWSSSDTSDQDERKKRASVSSTNSSSYHKKKSFEGPLSRSSSRKTSDMKKDSSRKSKKSEFERPSDFGSFANRFSKENNNNDSGKNGRDSFKEDQGDVFEEVDDDLTYDQSPKFRRSISNAPSNDPSSWRRSALRIKRKAKSYSKIDEALDSKTDRSRAKMSLQHPIISVIEDEPNEIPTRNQRFRQKKMSLQVPIPQQQSSSSPVSDNSPNFKSYIDEEDEFNEYDTVKLRSVSPNFSPPSFSLPPRETSHKKDKSKRKHRSVSTILKPVWESETMQKARGKASERAKPFFDSASEKARPYLESEVGSYLVEKIDKVFISIIYKESWSVTIS